MKCRGLLCLLAGCVFAGSAFPCGETLATSDGVRRNGEEAEERKDTRAELLQAVKRLNRQAMEEAGIRGSLPPFDAWREAGVDDPSRIFGISFHDLYPNAFAEITDPDLVKRIVGAIDRASRVRYRYAMGSSTGVITFHVGAFRRFTGLEIDRRSRMVYFGDGYRSGELYEILEEIDRLKPVGGGLMPPPEIQRPPISER